MFLKRFQSNDTGRNAVAPVQNDRTMHYISRRRFLAGTGALTIGVTLGSRVMAQDQTATDTLAEAAGGDAMPSLWVSIEKDGTVRITCHRSEMGQHVWTSMAQIVADELEADWDKVAIVQAEGHPKYGDQNTDGSRSVRYNFHRLRLAGAAMRSMLEKAAAAKWRVEASAVSSEQGFVTNASGGERLSYGELAEAAGKLPLPAESDVSLKSRDQWRYIGKSVPSLTVPKITRGQGTFGIDVDRPGMVYAVVARPPQLFGSTGAVDDTKARKVPGVLNVMKLPDATPPAAFKPLGGVAVVARDTWSAIKGRQALEVEWKNGPNADYNSADYRLAMQATAREPGNARLNRGDAVDAIAKAGKKVTAEYYVPHFAHSPMEPPCATAEWSDGHLTCWASVQDPQSTRNTLAGFLGIEPDKVTVYPTWLGGAFGRKSKPDFVIEAALIAREMGKPVKVTWTREDDIRHDYYHSVSCQRFEGALDEDGRCSAFLHRTVFPSIVALFNPEVDEGVGLELGLGATDTPFAVPNLRVESGKAAAHVRIGWLRSVSNIYHAFGVQSFAAELAYAAGRDPRDYLLELIGPDRNVDPTKEGAGDYANYDAPLSVYPISTGRLSNVVEVAADMARWGRALPKGHGLGIAVHRSFLTYVATVVEVAVADDGAITIPGVWLAADAGTVVNPRHATAQLEGGTLYGLSNALYGEITLSNGAVDQTNFPGWRAMRMSEAPRAFDVRIIESNEPPAGIGEPATPPAAPALTNAIFAATGIRVRDLPILGPNRQKLKLNA